MRHIRCRLCGENRKRRSTRSYAICGKCHQAACNRCVVEVNFVAVGKSLFGPVDRKTVKRCKFCVAEEVLSK